jgi:hypothetical protein
MTKHATSINVDSSDCGYEWDYDVLHRVVDIIADVVPHVEELYLRGCGRGDYVKKLINLRKLVTEDIGSSSIADIVNHRLEILKCRTRTSGTIDISFVALRKVDIYADVPIHKTICKQLSSVVFRVPRRNGGATQTEDYIMGHDAVINHELFPNLIFLKYLFKSDYIERREQARQRIIDEHPNSTLAAICNYISFVKFNHFETENYSFKIIYRQSKLTNIIIQKISPGPVDLHSEIHSLLASFY